MNMQSAEEQERSMIIQVHEALMIVSYLDQVDYSLARFNVTRNIDDLDAAERFADVVRSYLPAGLQEMNIRKIREMYWSLSPKQASNEY